MRRASCASCAACGGCSRRRVQQAAGAAGGGCSRRGAAARWRGAHHCAKARGVGVQRARQRERARRVRLRRSARGVAVAPRLQPAHHRQHVGRRAALVRGATGMVPRGPQLAAAAHVREREHPAARRQHSALCAPLSVQRHTICRARRGCGVSLRACRWMAAALDWRSRTGPVYGQQSGVCCRRRRVAETTPVEQCHGDERA